MPLASSNDRLALWHLAPLLDLATSDSAGRKCERPYPLIDATGPHDGLDRPTALSRYVSPGSTPHKTTHQSSEWFQA